MHSIALSDQADRDGLAKISGRTGGITEIASTAADLQRIMAILFGQAEGGETLLAESGTLRTGEQKSHRFPVEPGMGGLDIQVSWPGSDIDLVVHDPHGNVISTKEAVRAGRGAEGETYDIIQLKNPAAGEWRVTVKGVQLAAAGEPYDLRVMGRDPAIKTKWQTNVVVPEIGQPYTVSVDDGSGIAWEKSVSLLRLPDGTQQRDTHPLNGLAVMLSGGSSHMVYELIPDRKGVYRLQLRLEGRDSSGMPVVRSIDRTFRVEEPGRGVAYQHDIDAFIRRVPGMLQ